MSIAPDGTIVSNDQVYLVPPPIITADTITIQEANPTAVVITPESLPPDVGIPVGNYLGYPDPDQPPPFSGGFMSIGGGIVPGSPRADWYDRLVQTQSAQYSITGLAPHSSTVRWSASVPTGQLWFLHWVIARLRRSNTPGTPGEAQAAVTCSSFNGASDVTVVGPYVEDPVPDNQPRRDYGQPFILMTAGGRVQGVTYDSSGGGIADYLVSALWSQFTL